MKICFCLLLSVSCFATDISSKLRSFYFDPDVSQLPISDWNNPTLQDYQLIRGFLLEKKKRLVNSRIEDRPFPTEELNTKFFGWTTYRMGSILGPIEDPESGIEYFGNDPNQREKCVICYVTRKRSKSSRDYVKGLQWIIKSLKSFNFDGHLIYYIGGWPNIKKGRLKYADVPYGFKPFLFEEARDRGYKNILWLDACVVPVKSLRPIFSHMKTKGVCLKSFYGTMNNRSFNDGYKCLMPSLNITDFTKYECFTSPVVGFNVENKKANHLLSEWIQLAEEKVPMLMGDQESLSFLANQLNLQEGRMPRHFYVEMTQNGGDFCYWKKDRRAILMHQYNFLDTDVKVPYDLFRKFFRGSPRRNRVAE